MQGDSDAAECCLEIEADTQFIDPCEKASKASLDCLERTHYNKAEVSCYVPLKLTWTVLRVLQGIQRMQEELAGAEEA